MGKPILDSSFYFNKYPFFTHIIRNEPASYHSHRFIEISYVLSGQCSHILNGNESILSKGDIFILTPNDYHAFIHQKNQCVRRDILLPVPFFKEICDFLSPDLFNKFQQNNLAKIKKINSEYLSEIETAVSRTDLLLNSPINTDNFLPQIKICSCKIIEIFLTNQPTIHYYAPKWVLELIDILNNGFEISTPLTEILAKFNYDYSYMRKTFKKYTGLSMTDFRLNTQLRYALTLLKTTDAPISDIAFQSGFNNLPYFYKSFKEKFGTSPAKSRKAKNDSSAILNKTDQTTTNQ